MKEQFVTYEIALALKELGFNEISRFGNEASLYSKDKKFTFYTNYGFMGSGLSDGYIKAPLWQQVIDWLREKYNINILQICPIPPEAIKAAKGNLDNKKGYGFFLYNINWNPRIPNLDVWEENFYKGREQAILKAIQLIEQNNENNN